MRKLLLNAELLESRETPTVLPPGFTESIVTTGLTRPVAMTQAPDGRFFVTEQGGTLRVVTAEGQLLADPFVSLAVDSSVERGLLGVVLDPNFATNNYVYVYYTVPGTESQSPFNRISRFTASGNVAVPGSEQILVNLDPLLGSGNHNGGALAFGPDGKLYVAVGDATDPVNSQLLSTRHGKILRYNPDGSIPNDNPTQFDGIVGTTEGPNRAIWAVGLRNSFTFAFQPGTGRFYANDVGASAAEEVNEILPGKNYGFPITEGDFDQSQYPALTRPIISIPRGDVPPTLPVAITGGAFYNPATPTFPGEYVGDYFFGDFASRYIKRYDPETKTLQDFATSLTGVDMVDLDITPQGDLLYLSYHYLEPQGGGIYRIQKSQAPAIARQPSSITVQPGNPATFSVQANGTPPLAYQWQRNGVDLPGETGPTLTLASPQLGDTGTRFRVVVRNDAGMVTSNEATLTVTDDKPPVPVILTPTAGATFIAGQTFTFSGSATDPEDGVLPDSAYTWRVDYITGSAPAGTRPHLPDTSGITSGTFTIPTTTPYAGINVYYEVVLTVRDSAGNTTTVTRQIQPVVADVTLASTVAGADVLLDGHAYQSPTTFTLVAGYHRQLEAPAEATINGVRWAFIGWTDGDPNRVRALVTPTEATTYTARYAPHSAATASPLLIGSGKASHPGARIFQFNAEESGPGTVDLGDEFAGGVRVATRDVTGDGIADHAYGAGPGRGSTVAVVDGQSGAVLQRFEAFEPSFTGGVFVALADLDGDGLAELVVSPDVGGGPRVRVLRVADLAVLADFFGIEDPAFRGGARVAGGDVNGDGREDVIVAAGYLGGPRIAGWDGSALAAGQPVHAFADFFAFESSLRTGLYIAAGDVDADGRADLVVGGGMDAGPRVSIFSGARLADGTGAIELCNYFAGDPASRTGARVGTKDIDRDGLVDLVVGLTGVARGYLSGELTAAGTHDHNPNHEWTDLGDGFAGPIYVG
jgi:glucose/arabinose dehydrogenase